ncbi:MAG TPA: 3-keto-5-aminohexanoate cleavage protein [Rubrobacter sp.]|nr:3-keto-5-aminohexanoate cleavage protein [Rubrobacter sp.]
MIGTGVGLQAALNRDRTKGAHAATPVSVEELARDAVACVAAGARAIHLHPRDPEGRETLAAGVVDEVVRKVRDACGVPVGVTTSAEIEPDPERRLDLVRAWCAPDYTSVNLSEPGATEVMEALIGAGIGIEAGVWTVEDAERLAASGSGGRVTRILVEPGELQLRDGEDRAADAVGLVEDIHEALDRFGLTAPRLQHGDGEVTWTLLEDAIRRGLDTRIGLEDTLHGPDGERTSGNEALVRAARELGAGTD